MKRNLVPLIASTLLALGGLATFATLAFAQQFTREADLVGSIEVPLGTRLAADLAELATVTEAEAVAAARAALGTSDAPTEVELEIENGFLVWEVEFAAHEVVVDAGAAAGAEAPRVLLVEDESDPDDDDEEEAEGAADDAD